MLARITHDACRSQRSALAVQHALEELRPDSLFDIVRTDGERRWTVVEYRRPSSFPPDPDGWLDRSPARPIVPDAVRSAGGRALTPVRRVAGR